MTNNSVPDPTTTPLRPKTISNLISYYQTGPTGRGIQTSISRLSNMPGFCGADSAWNSKKNTRHFYCFDSKIAQLLGKVENVTESDTFQISSSDVAMVLTN